MASTERTSITVTAKIHAPVEIVWECWTVPIHIMHWNNASEDWHTPWAENDLQAGGKFCYRMESRDGKTGGMASRIKENIAGRFISIEHLAILKDDHEITSGPEVKDWAGALENYSFREKNGHTILSVDMNTNEEFKTYFLDTWPKALKKLKSICEAQ